jgi:hypothetical protein
MKELLGKTIVVRRPKRIPVAGYFWGTFKGAKIDEKGLRTALVGRFGFLNDCRNGSRGFTRQCQ